MVSLPNGTPGTTNAPLPRSKMEELLERARSMLSEREKETANQLQQILETNNVTHVDFTGTGISNEAISTTDEGAETAADIIRDVISTMSASSGESTDSTDAGTGGNKQHGVSREITLNAKQQLFLSEVVAGNDVVLIGAAGTGKTTSMRKTTRAMIDSGRLPIIVNPTRYLQSGKPGMVITSYTRKAVNNIRHAVVDELKTHTITTHKLLEFAPVVYQIEDPENPGQLRTTMKFEPRKNGLNPLPTELVCIAFEESSMEAVELYALVQEAMPHPHQEIFLGDIQQLPPVFGMAILGFKMLELPVVELTEVYRQARESPVLDLAWLLLEGDPTGEVFSSASETREEIHPATGKLVSRKRIPALEKLCREQLDPETGEVLSSLRIQPWQKKLDPELGVITAAKQFTTWAEQGYYNPEEDIILCPFNKSFGTIELNLRISQFLGRKRDADVYEVIAGFNKHYLAVGDRVLYDKEDAFITSISRNIEYFGKTPQAHSIHLNRWGHLETPLTEEEKLLAEAEAAELSNEQLEKLMSTADSGIDDRVTAASHDITIRYAYGDADEELLSKASQVNNLLGGYAITVHKAQGSEWAKGFIVLSHTHATMNSRELLYTAVTRHSKFLHIICEPDTFERGVASQRIFGNTLAEKALYFQGKAEKGDNFDIQSTHKAGGQYTPKTANNRSTSVSSRHATYSEDELGRLEDDGAGGAILRYTSRSVDTRSIPSKLEALRARLAAAQATSTTSQSKKKE